MKTFSHKGKYSGEVYNLSLTVSKYANGQTALQLYDMADGLPYAVASVAVDCELKENEVAIKDYSENEGILNSLIKNDIVEKPHRYTSSGFVKIPICILKTDKS